ncbi:MAG: hypothetical protein JWN40_2938 [Phycisphaerales bacterium]|nr:hypothetical protein [Phycisphaerales bacterium]
MDFIERWFGISPDRGSGAFEFIILFAIVAIAGIVWFRRSIVRGCLHLVARLRHLSHR